MLLTQFIHNDLPKRKQTDKPHFLIQIMTDYKISHLPMIDEKGKFLGNLNEFILIAGNISELQFFALKISDNIFDAITLMNKEQTNILPIITPDNQFLGYILAEDILAYLAKIPFFSQEGALLVVEITTPKYALSEVTKIIESNNSQIYGTFLHYIDTEKAQILIKLSHENLGSVIETFERFGYTLIYQSQDNTHYNYLKDRLDNLMNYLDT